MCVVCHSVCSLDIWITVLVRLSRLRFPQKCSPSIQISCTHPRCGAVIWMDLVVGEEVYQVVSRTDMPHEPTDLFMYFFLGGDILIPS